MRSYAYPSGGPGAAETGPTRRDVALQAVAVAGLAMCITLIFLVMRSVMAVGGSCADGGPYVSAQHCPQGSTVGMLLGMPGLFLFGGISMVAGRRVGGIWAATFILAWAGLFISLGWNFFEWGVLAADPKTGPDFGWAVCAVLFFLMGGVPLVGLIAIGPWRTNAAWGLDGSNAEVVARRRRLEERAAKLRAAQEPDTHLPHGEGIDLTAAAMPATAVGHEAGDVVGRLERLAALHERGAITEAEFDEAKRAVLDGRRSAS